MSLNEKEKDIIKSKIKLINELGCELDDELEELENNLKLAEISKNIFDDLNSKYLLMSNQLERDLESEKLTQKEFFFGKRVSIFFGKIIEEKKIKAENEVLALNSKIELLQKNISSLKTKLDQEIQSLEAIIKEEQKKKLEEDKLLETKKEEEKNENIEILNKESNQKHLTAQEMKIAMIRRPVGTHPGNLLADRKKAIIEKELNVQNIESKKEEIKEEIKENILPVKKKTGRKKKTIEE